MRGVAEKVLDLALTCVRFVAENKAQIPFRSMEARVRFEDAFSEVVWRIESAVTLFKQGVPK